MFPKWQSWSHEQCSQCMSMWQIVQMNIPKHPCSNLQEKSSTWGRYGASLNEFLYKKRFICFLPKTVELPNLLIWKQVDLSIRKRLSQPVDWIYFHDQYPFNLPLLVLSKCALYAHHSQRNLFIKWASVMFLCLLNSSLQYWSPMILNSAGSDRWSRSMDLYRASTWAPSISGKFYFV